MIHESIIKSIIVRLPVEEELLYILLDRFLRGILWELQIYCGILVKKIKNGSDTLTLTKGPSQTLARLSSSGIGV